MPPEGHCLTIVYYSNLSALHIESLSQRVQNNQSSIFICFNLLHKVYIQISTVIVMGGLVFCVLGH